MEPVKCHGNAPSVQLLNEIDILLTQMRLAELYLKQAQAATADQVARVHERYESELENLRAAIRQKERSVNENSLRIAAAEQLHIQIQDLQARLEEHRRLLEQKDGELRGATAKLEASRVQVAQLQSAAEETFTAARDGEQIGQRVRAELEDLDARLASKDRELQTDRESAAELQASLNATIGGLRLELAEELDLAEGRDKEIRDLGEKTRGLLEQIAQLESSNLHLQTGAADVVERYHEAHQAELAALQNQLQLRDEALAEQEARGMELERRLGTRIFHLETELAARQRLLEERWEALQTANSSAVALQERLTRLEASSRNAQGARGKDTDLMRATLEAELADLRSELQQKEWAVAQRQALIDNLGLGHKERIRTLETELAELRQAAKNHAMDLDKASSQRQQLLCRIDQLESAAADAEATAISRVEQITHRYEIQMAALDVENEQRTVALEEHRPTRNDLERIYHVELSQLRAESQAKHRLLENRNEEFVAMKNAMDSLRERLTQLETAAAHAEQTGAENRERLRVEYEAQLAALRQELSRREPSDKDQGTMEIAHTKPGQTFYSRSDRRWRSSGGWKRRWKT
jgi:chromosome segregation ATPase